MVSYVTSAMILTYLLQCTVCPIIAYFFIRYKFLERERIKPKKVFFLAN